MRALWDEFEAMESAEAKFARAMDCIQPMMLNDATDGLLWVKNQICLSQVMKRNEKVSLGSEKLWEYAYDTFIEPNVVCGKIIDDRKEDEK